MSKVLSTKIVKTRKPHNCFGCGRGFPAGTNMERSAIIDGKPFTLHLCKTCQEVIQGMNYYDDFGYGDLHEDALTLELQKLTVVRRTK